MADLKRSAKMRVGKIIALLVTASVVAWVGWAFRKEAQLSGAFAAVEKGDSEARVLELFGRPKSVTGVPENIAWGTEDSIRKNSGECTRVFWYRRPINFDGGAWVVGFDKEGKVVSKYRYASP